MSRASIVESQFVLLRGYLKASIRAAKKDGDSEATLEARNAAAALLIIERQIAAGKKAVRALNAINPLLEQTDREWRARVKALREWDAGCQMPELEC